MKKNLYDELYLLEEKHWWHLAKRDICLKLLRKYLSKKNSKILDIGCGTGKNIEALSEFGEIWGIDISKNAISYCKKRGLKNVKLAKAEETGFKENSFDAIVLLDVLEHVDDTKTIKEIFRILKPGGLVLITVPAYSWLWSKWDEVLHHKRRYTKKSLIKLFDDGKFNNMYASYAFSYLLIPAYVIRKIKSVFLKKDYPSDFKLSSKSINSTMFFVSKTEHFFSKRGLVPFGTSIIYLGRKNV
ncbi:class I SAM-dependent methyltransferase [Patescibacteria group bacterium]|nr:class I SAM-dependent methyltransferase [Patescibacteria group bacterium]